MNLPSDSPAINHALAIGPALGLVMTYDVRLRDAALTQGLDIDSAS
jgi:hypothetical protein